MIADPECLFSLAAAVAISVVYKERERMKRKRKLADVHSEICDEGSDSIYAPFSLDNVQETRITLTPEMEPFRSIDLARNVPSASSDSNSLFTPQTNISPEQRQDYGYGIKIKQEDIDAERPDDRFPNAQTTKDLLERENTDEQGSESSSIYIFSASSPKRQPHPASPVSSTTSPRKRHSSGISGVERDVDELDVLDRALRDLSPIRSGNNGLREQPDWCKDKKDSDLLFLPQLSEPTRTISQLSTSSHLSASSRFSASSHLSASQSSTSACGSQMSTVLFDDSFQEANGQDENTVTTTPLEEGNDYCSVPLPTQTHTAISCTKETGQRQEAETQLDSSNNPMARMNVKDEMAPLNVSFVSIRSTGSVSSRILRPAQAASLAKLRIHWSGLVETMHDGMMTLSKGLLSKADLIAFISRPFAELRTFFSLPGRPTQMQSQVLGYMVNCVKVYELLVAKRHIMELFSLLPDFVIRLISRFLATPQAMRDTNRGWIQARTMLHLLVSIPSEMFVLMALQGAVKQMHAEFLNVYGSHLMERRGGTQSDIQQEFVLFASREMETIEGKMQSRMEQLSLQATYGV